MVILVFVTIGSQQLRARRMYEVAKPTENIRSSPEGLRLGVLEKGTQIEEVGRDGQWVKFEMVAWIWGPSLEGFDEDNDNSSSRSRSDRSGSDRSGSDRSGSDRSGSDRSGSGASISEDDDSPSSTRGQRQPRRALNTHLDDIRDLVDEDFGRFYGLSHNAELGIVVLRFKVPDVGEEALFRRQMRAQAQVDEILASDVDYGRLRIETNRPDGTGAVGQYVAVADTGVIRRIAGEDLAAWLEAVERSDDGGATWK